MKTGHLFAASAVNQGETLLALSSVARQAAGRAWGQEIRWASLTPPRGPFPAGGPQPVLLSQALCEMERDGFTQVALQPLQVVSGTENDKLRAEVDAFQRGSSGVCRIAVGAPLLGCGEDLERVARALLADAAGFRKPGDALILIGHGSTGHAADLAYPAAAWMLGALDPLAFLGCVNGMPDRADVVRRCREARVKRAYLLPFTLAAGSTVRAALAGSGAGSWIEALAGAGIEGVPIPKGLGQNEGVVAVWLDHMEAARKEMGEAT